MARGIVEVPAGGMPTDDRTWRQFLAQLNSSIKYQNGILISALRLVERDGITIDEALELIGDDGRATDQRFLRMLTFGGVGSVQAASPLTATADSLTAVVQVAGHSLYIGAETLVYSGGSISGLVTETDYFIVGDDPDLTGGTITYTAVLAANVQQLAGTVNRYLVGAIRTPLSTISAAMTAATNANPCAVTTGAAHGMSTADLVTFSGVGGMTQLNTLPANAITVTSPTSFTLDGVNATAFGVYTSGGTVTRVATGSQVAGGGGSGYVYDPNNWYY